MPTLLVIEDNRVIRENTSELLEMEGYIVIAATNGNDGFRKIKDFRPDLIICDVLMPEMGGLDLLAKLGLHKQLKTIPLIFYSARSEKRDINSAMEMGAYDYIVKPSDLQDLLASIRKCLESRKFS